MSESDSIWSSSQIRFHHVGTLVSSIDEYLKNSFWQLKTPIVYDPYHKARLCLVGFHQDDEHWVELLEPVGKDSPINLASEKGQKLHHLCFETQHCEFADEIIRKYRLLQVTDWQPAVLFEQRPVRFVYTRHRELMEFLASE